MTLNPGEALWRTIASLEIQQFHNFEHIIKDAGSTDGSLSEYVRRTENYSTRVICMPDAGIYDAMNQALEYANGKYVLFLNAGDKLFSCDVLGEVAQVVEKYPDLGIVYGDYFSEPLNLVVNSPRKLSRFFLYRTTLCHQTIFAKNREIEEIGGFDISLRVLADYDLLLRMNLISNISCFYMNKAFVSYMGGGFSTKSDNVKIAIQEAVMLRHKYYRLVDRLLYGALRALTLPKLRIMLMQSSSLLSLQKVYTRVVNILNSLS